MNSQLKSMWCWHPFFPGTLLRAQGHMGVLALKNFAAHQKSRNVGIQKRGKVSIACGCCFTITVHSLSPGKHTSVSLQRGVRPTPLHLWRYKWLSSRQIMDSGPRPYDWFRSGHQTQKRHIQDNLSHSSTTFELWI